MAERFSREPVTSSECYHSEPINPFRELNLTILFCIDLREIFLSKYFSFLTHSLGEKPLKKTAVRCNW